MCQPCEMLYNRFLDVTAFVSLPVKIFTMVIVLRYTPQNMRFLSFFLLNGLAWNFGGNMMCAFVHVYPMYPAQCFRIDGLVGILENELLGHIMLLLLFVCILNCIIALMTTFTYRYFIYMYANEAKYLDHRYAFIVCLTLHSGTTALTVFFYIQWMTSLGGYRGEDDSKYTYCFKPDGWQKKVALYTTCVVVGVSILIAASFSIKLFISIKRTKGNTQRTNFNNRNRILWTLATVSSCPLFFGAVPLIIAVITSLEPNVPHGSQICLVCISMLANHGTLYAVSLILSMKPYRKAAVHVLKKFSFRRPYNNATSAKPLFFIGVRNR
uniref:G_PROTEIN_RECEP_F1_2 domain-containing protein n=1 Tax=Steinernema glaseri TaxID=37863 RepID=A0A1I7ZCK0_9BILA